MADNLTSADKVDVNDMTSIGFLCEFDDRVAKFYTLEYGLVEMEKEEGSFLELAQWYDLYDGCYEYKEFECNICEPREENGMVIVNTVAIGPNDWQLPKEIRRKYEMKVWSPWLKFLNDASDKFRNTTRGGDVREVICKYAPSEEGIFEIMDCTDKDCREGSATCDMAPWHLEFIASKMETTVMPKSHKLVTFNQHQRVSPEQISAGICIFHTAMNVAFKQGPEKKNSDGCHPTCSYIWSGQLGLVRWTHGDPMSKGEHPKAHVQVVKEDSETMSENVPGPKLPPKQHVDPTEKVAGNMRSVEHRIGRWVTFTVYDCQKKNNHLPPLRSIDRLTASHIKDLVDVPKHSRVVNGAVEIDASFIFNHDNLEFPDCRGIQDWNVRQSKLRKDACFWDFELGKVEVYPNHSRLIIEQIEAHRNSLTPDHREKLEDQAIVVFGTTKVHRNWLQNWENYPQCGVFVLDRIHQICYLNKGRVIYKRPGFP